MDNRPTKRPTIVIIMMQIQALIVSGFVDSWFPSAHFGEIQWGEFASRVSRGPFS